MCEAIWASSKYSNSNGLLTKPYDRSNQSLILIAAIWYFPQKFPMREGGSERRGKLIIITEITAHCMGFGDEKLTHLTNVPWLNLFCDVDSMAFECLINNRFVGNSTCPEDF